jgi:hypothetical protein
VTVSGKEVFHRIEQVVRRRILREMKGDICGLVFATEGPGHDSLRWDPVSQYVKEVGNG